MNECINHRIIESIVSSEKNLEKRKFIDQNNSKKKNTLKIIVICMRPEF